jgi:hypothetical protein
MKLIRFLLLLIMIITGSESCGIETSKIVPIWLDERFSSEEVQEIKIAVEEWNVGLNNYLFLKVGVADSEIWANKDKKKDIWIIVRSNNEETKNILPNKPTALGFTDKIEGSVIYLVMDRIMAVEDIHYIMKHEIGHLLGCKHTEKYLMNPYFDHNNPDSAKCLDQLTMTQVAGFLDVDLNDLKYCRRED